MTMFLVTAASSILTIVFVLAVLATVAILAPPLVYLWLRVADALRIGSAIHNSFEWWKRWIAKWDYKG